MKTKLFFVVIFFIIGTVGCVDVDNEMLPATNLKSASLSDQLVLNTELLNKINVQLEAQGKNFRIAMVDLLTLPKVNGEGTIIYSQIVGDKMLGADFVPGDLRREWSGNGGTEITFAIDQVDAEVSALNATQTTDAIERGFNTWDSADCSELGLTRVPDYGYDIGFFSYSWWNDNYNEYPQYWQGSPYIFADIHQCGWGDLPLSLETLGLTITYIWVENSVPTDINGDGLMDVAFRETYYNEYLTWGLADNLPEGSYEVETVAVHEIGHCLSQGHFGTILVIRNRTIKASPRAVMNEFYLGVLTDLQGTDIGGHCGIWDTWPSE